MMEKEKLSKKESSNGEEWINCILFKLMFLLSF